MQTILRVIASHLGAAVGIYPGFVYHERTLVKLARSNDCLFYTDVIVMKGIKCLPTTPLHCAEEQTVALPPSLDRPQRPAWLSDQSKATYNSAMTLQAPARVIDQPVACSFCYRTVRTSQLAEHVSWHCGKAPAARKARTVAALAATPVSRQKKKKKKNKGVAQAAPVKASPGGMQPRQTLRPDAPHLVPPPIRPATPLALLPRHQAPKGFYTPDEFKLIGEAYRHLFGAIGPELRAYWDLDRKRPWGCLTTDFERATYGQHEEATRRALEIERTVFDPLLRGRALRDVTRQTGVGLSLGICPWTDHGLLQTYARNQHKRRLTIILGHDWYPIVPEREHKMHPVDAPLRRSGGLHDLKAYINRGAVPAAIMDKSELLLFLNFHPDFRPPNTPVEGPFNPYDRSAEGFGAVLQAVTREFKVQVISWSGPVWNALSKRFINQRKPDGVCVRVRNAANFGRPLELHIGRVAIPYLPLAHPCKQYNFCSHHAAHAHEGFLKMGLGGRGRFGQLVTASR